MKRFWIAAALLLVLFGGTLLNNHYLGRFTTQLSQLLTQAGAAVTAEDWPAAVGLTQRADALWHDQDVYLHTLLRHGDIDAIHVTFGEVLAYLSYQDSAAYSAANARLVTEIELLYEAEQLNLKNVF